MSNYFMILLFFVMGSIANAKIYYSKDVALIYFMQNEENVNAIFCQNISESDAKAIYQFLNWQPQVLNYEKCQFLSVNGINRQTIELKIPEIKEKMRQSIEDYRSSINIKNYRFDIITGLWIEIYPAPLTHRQYKKISSINSESIFSELEITAKNPMLKYMSLDAINKEIDNFLWLVR